MNEFQRLELAFQASPLIAILRGIRFEEAAEIVAALYETGVRVAEVPLNSPNPYATISMLVERFGDRMVIGGGTVTTSAQVAELAKCRASICVSPNSNTEVIRAALLAGMVPIPGFQTASEAFAAYENGARYLKFFPAASNAPALSALSAVLPKEVRVVAVGGVGLDSYPKLLAAGATIFGVGSDIFRPGFTAEQVRSSSNVLVREIESANAKRVRIVCNPEALIGEAPCVIKGNDAICWVDPLQKRMMSASLPDGTLKYTMLSEAVWSIAPLPKGELVGTISQGFCTIELSTGLLTKGPIAPQGTGCRFNDMTVDPLGGLWAGSMHKGLLSTAGALFYSSEATKPSRKVAEGLGVPNGMKFSNDGKTLYVLDTLARHLLAYPANIELGALGEPYVLTDFMGIPGKPDGMALDNDGNFWVAMWGGSCVVQIDANGALLRVIALPAPNVSSACLGSRGTLYVSTSRMRLSQDQLIQAPASGALFAISLD